jgi:hypothetical protein
MKESKTGYLLRILICKDDKYNGRPLYEQIILKAKELKLLSATVLKSIMGFGADSLIHTAKVLQLSEDIPIVIEIVDAEQNINKILPFLDESVKVGLVTIEKATIIKYSSSK